MMERQFLPGAPIHRVRNTGVKTPVVDTSTRSPAGPASSGWRGPVSAGPPSSATSPATSIVMMAKWRPRRRSSHDPEEFSEGLWKVLQDHVQQWCGGAFGLGIACPTAAHFHDHRELPGRRVGAAVTSGPYAPAGTRAPGLVCRRWSNHDALVSSLDQRRHSDRRCMSRSRASALGPRVRRMFPDRTCRAGGRSHRCPWDLQREAGHPNNSAQWG